MAVVRPPRVPAALVFLVVVASAATGAQAAMIYGQRTGTRVDRIEVSEHVQQNGTMLDVVITSGESYQIESDVNGGVTTCRFEFPSDRTAWTARRYGSSLRLEGTLKGRRVSRTFAVGDRIWYESVERSLQSFAVSGSSRTITFWMIEPYGGKAYLMTGRIDAHERIEVNGEDEDAVRVVVRPAGLLSLLWSNTYWYAPGDGTFLKSQSVHAIPPLGPPTVVELLEDLRTR